MADATRAAMQEAELTAIMAIKAMLATVLTEATEIVISAVASTIMDVTIAFAIIIPTTSTAATSVDSETVVEQALEAERIPVAVALAEAVEASEVAVAQVAAASAEEDSRFLKFKVNSL